MAIVIASLKYGRGDRQYSIKQKRPNDDRPPTWGTAPARRAHPTSAKRRNSCTPTVTGCRSKTPRTGQLVNDRMCFLQVWSLGVQGQHGRLRDLPCRRLLSRPRLAKGPRETSWATFIKTLIPFTRLCHHNAVTSHQPRLQIGSTLGVVSMYGF